MAALITPLFIVIIFIGVILLFAKPKLVLPLFIGTLPLETLVESDIYSLPKILGVLAFLSFLVIAIREKRKINFDFPLLILFLFLIWGAVSYFWSVAPDSTLIKLTTILQLLVLYFLMINQIRDYKSINKIMEFLFMGAIVYSLFGIFDLVFLLSNNENLRLASIAKNANTYFIISICLIPACYWVLQQNRHFFLKLISIFVIMALLITSLYTQSRGGLISLGVFFLSYFLLSGKKVSWMLLIIIFGTVVYILIPESFVERFSDISTSIRVTELWPAGIRAFNDRPISGYGLGTNSVILPTFLRRVNYFDQLFSVHSAPLSVSIELGLPGLLLYLTFIFAPTFKLLKTIWKLRINHNMMINLSCVIFSVLMAYLATWIKGGGSEYQKMLWVLIGLETCLAIIINERATRTFSRHKGERSLTS